MGIRALASELLACAAFSLVGIVFALIIANHIHPLLLWASSP